MIALPLTYHWRNLFVRKTTTVLTVLVVTAVVGVFAWMAGFAQALDRSLSFASDSGKLIVLKRGATAEGNSAIPIEEFNRLAQLDEVARDPAGGGPLQSPEMLVQVSLPRVRDGGATHANVAVRGVTEAALKVHRNVRPAGPFLSTGGLDVVVGQKASEQFAGLRVGDVVKLGFGGQRVFRVVGCFSADGGPMESEIWAYLPALMNAYNRSMYSSVSLRLRDGVDPARVVEKIEGPAIQLAARTERDYWQEQSRFIRVYLMITRILVGIMSLAAVFSIANTMFSSVAGRTRELAMLRTIGFPRYEILLSVVIESLFLAVLGGLLGCAGCAAWLWLAGGAKDMFGASTFTVLAFDIRLTPWIVLYALALVGGVAVVGALTPALRASRLDVVTALREA
jgi:putative ABC transport system permease protein